jgi:hypothetical protein
MSEYQISTPKYPDIGGRDDLAARINLTAMEARQ